MQRSRVLLSFTCGALAALAAPGSSATAQVGQLLRVFPVPAGELLLDPARPQLYATEPGVNSVAVINTDSNTLVGTLPTGVNPVALAISPDGTRLYVANFGSTTAGIGVVDLTTLTTLPSLPVPFQIASIAAGLGNRLYVLGAGTDQGGTTGIAQLDATTGDVQGMLPTDAADYIGFLQISPDYTTLYYGDAAVSPSSLASFDVSTATPTLLQQSGFDATGSNGEGLTISHNGEYLVYPNATGNSSTGYTTSLIPTNNLNSIVGSFATGAYPGVAAFSADDGTLYQAQTLGANPYNLLNVYSTSTFEEIESFALPGVSTSNPAAVTSLAVTSPNGYLYVAATDGTSDENPANLLLMGTQQPPFFNGAAALSDGFYYLQFSDGSYFGYYNFNNSPYLYHSDLGFEYPIDAADASGGIYLYDFTSKTFFYTSASLFPYLYDFTLNAFLYYYPNTSNPGHYTSNPRYFYNFGTGKIITK